MRLHRFFIPFDYTVSEIVVDDKQLLHQIEKVFRMKKGDRFVLCDGRMHEVVVEIKKIDKNITATVIKRMTNDKEPRCNVTLYCALLKREQFEMVVQKTTEVGVRAIVPMITQRTIKRAMHKKRLEKIAKEAAEQSGRAVVPEVGEIVSFDDAYEKATMHDVNVCFDPNGAPVHNFMNDVWKTNPESVGIFIGPEGGFTEEELDVIKQQGISVISLGVRTLRAETAAIVATYLVATLPLVAN